MASHSLQQAWNQSLSFWRFTSLPSSALSLVSSIGGLPSARRVPFTNSAPWDAMCLLLRWRPALGLGPQNSSGLGKNLATPAAKALLMAAGTFLKFAYKKWQSNKHPIKSLITCDCKMTGYNGLKHHFSLSISWDVGAKGLLSSEHGHEFLSRNKYGTNAVNKPLLCNWHFLENDLGRRKHMFYDPPMCSHSGQTNEQDRGANNHKTRAYICETSPMITWMQTS